MYFFVFLIIYKGENWDWVLTQLVWTWCIMHPVCLWRGPTFRPTGPDMGGGGGKGLLQTDSAWHSRISTWPGPTLPDFDLTRPSTPGFRPTGPSVGGGGGKGLLQIDSTRFFARYFTGLSLPPPPKTSVIDTETTQTVAAGRQQVQWAGVYPGRPALPCPCPALFVTTYR